MRKILKAAIRIGGKVYTGDNHGIAMEKARREGKKLPPKDGSEYNDFRERNGMFLLSDGKLIARAQAMREFGIDHSEDIPDQEPQGPNIPQGTKKRRKFVLVTKSFVGLGYALDYRLKGILRMR